MAGDTICRMGSMTKPIVAACAMTLVEDCTLRLDDPVDDLLPELANMTVLADPNGPLDDTVAAKRPISKSAVATADNSKIVLTMLIAFPVAAVVGASNAGIGNAAAMLTACAKASGSEYCTASRSRRENKACVRIVSSVAIICCHSLR